MNILVIAPDYPDDKRANFVFVKQLVDEMATQGHSIQVIAPYNVTHNRRIYNRIETVNCGSGTVTVYRPAYLSFSNITIGKFRPSSWSINCAYKKGLKLLRTIPDVVYGHFWTSGYAGYQYAREHHIPLYVATGESDISFRNDSTEKDAFCKYVKGVICVSTKNKEESIRLGLTDEDKCVVVPNAIDSTIFKKLDKSICRNELGFPQEAFITAFVGWFNERKGSERVASAISMTKSDATTVYSFFIGDGGADPKCNNILFKGKLQHDEIPKYLNAADVFVLPTLQEGCCNAVIEAMACGLPIVSSNLPFNWDVLDATNSIMIDPRNIGEIATAIRLLRDNIELCEKLSKGSLKSAEKLSIDQRATRIVDFIKG